MLDKRQRKNKKAIAKHLNFAPVIRLYQHALYNTQCVPTPNISSNMTTIIVVSFLNKHIFVLNRVVDHIEKSFSPPYYKLTAKQKTHIVIPPCVTAKKDFLRFFSLFLNNLLTNEFF